MLTTPYLPFFSLSFTHSATVDVKPLLPHSYLTSTSPSTHIHSSLYSSHYHLFSSDPLSYSLLLSLSRSLTLTLTQTLTVALTLVLLSLALLLS